MPIETKKVADAVQMILDGSTQMAACKAYGVDPSTLYRAFKRRGLPILKAGRPKGTKNYQSEVKR